MTLSTKMVIRTDMSVLDVHKWVTENLVASLDVPNPIIEEMSYIDGGVWNVPGQGLQSLVSTSPSESHRETWEEYLEDYDPEDEDGARARWTAHDAAYASGSVVVDFDTPYGYRGKNGEGCTEQHAQFLLALLAKFGEDAVVWQNEYSGEWTTGWDDEAVADWLGGGDDAFKWVTSVVVPAIQEEFGTFNVTL